MLCEERLDEWCKSAGQVGTDGSLSFLLSWYDTINLDVLRHMREGAKWITDPNLIKQHQDRAYAFIQYANVHAWWDETSFLDMMGEEEVDENKKSQVMRN